MESAAVQVEMVIGGIDLAIVIGFLLLMTTVGYYMSKMAAQGVEEYFLGNNKIPWWILGVSTSTSNFDMTGTMIIVAMVFDLGYRGFLVEIRGGVGLSLAFLMIFLGKWMRRSRVMTSAQWMKIRFGEDKQGKAAHILSAVAQSLLSLGMIVYFCVGGGKFIEYFFPQIGQFGGTMILVAVGLFYTWLSGFYGVVFTDIVQMIILSFTAIYITVQGFNVNLSQYMADGKLAEGWLGIDLSMPEGLATAVTENTKQNIAQATAAIESGAEGAIANAEIVLSQNADKLAMFDGLFQFFAIIVFFYFFRVTLEGMAGVGGYTDQRFYAARNEKEASYLTLESIIISILRWSMVAGLVALGYWILNENNPEFAGAVTAITQDSETVLPAVIGTILPTGVQGLVIAGLVAAALSTFDSTLNAGASYLVIDIYKPYINPEASMKQLVAASKMATLGIAVVGVLLASVIPNINTIWEFITMALGAGMFVPLFLRWYWPRYNGWGFAGGTAAGIVSSLVIRLFFSGVPLYISFPSIIISSFIVSVVTSLMTEPVDEKVLIDFYLKINPLGFWRKYALIAEERGYITREERYERIIESLNEILGLCLAVPFQFTILLATMAFVFQDWTRFFTFGLIAFVCSIGLYFIWFKGLKTDEQCEEDDKKYGKLKAV